MCAWQSGAAVAGWSSGSDSNRGADGVSSGWSCLRNQHYISGLKLCLVLGTKVISPASAQVRASACVAHGRPSLTPHFHAVALAAEGGATVVTIYR